MPCSFLRQGRGTNDLGVARYGAATLWITANERSGQIYKEEGFEGNPDANNFHRFSVPEDIFTRAPRTLVASKTSIDIAYYIADGKLSSEFGTIQKIAIGQQKTRIRFT